MEARRSDKTYPMTSPELMRELGAYLLGKHNYLKVDVHNPDFKVIVEIRDYGAYIHGPKVPGEGGLPVGTSGRALNMLSGGIDSPVAAYRMAKRGLALDHIHFASPPYTSERAKLKVKALAQLTSIYTMFADFMDNEIVAKTYAEANETLGYDLKNIETVECVVIRVVDVLFGHDPAS